MRGIIIEQYGGPEVQQLRDDLPRPVACAGHVSVRVVCAGLNFMDVLTRRGHYARSSTYPVSLPCTLGMEGAGEVIEVGEGVTHLAIGDRVVWCTVWGSFAEIASIPAALAARLPDDIGFDVAAAAMFQGCTTHYLIHDTARLQPGDQVLVHAAAGAIGQLLVQMAKRRGSTVFTTASTAEKRAVALACGADHAFAYDDGGFAEAVRAATGGRGVDVVFDAVGRTTLRGSLRAARTRGLVVNYGAVSGTVNDLDPVELGEAGSLFLCRPRLADHMADATTVQRRADEVFSAVREGALRIEIATHTISTKWARGSP
ncbi:quinone oxidoreductase family protein [Acidovorax sp.]|uniref:quinone oxidoreductase family protein n=1 Tax=Acidovorax sp. TaxID=1872122 RepID=UPI003BB0A7DC